MKFLIDAQLPYRFKEWLSTLGHDIIHTLDLPHRNLTEDVDIVAIAEENNRIVVTKDSDFLNLHILHGVPRKLLIVSTGNIANKDLEILFTNNSDIILREFDLGAKIVELSKSSVSVYK